MVLPVEFVSTFLVILHNKLTAPNVMRLVMVQKDAKTMTGNDDDDDDQKVSGDDVVDDENEDGTYWREQRC